MAIRKLVASFRCLKAPSSQIGTLSFVIRRNLAATCRSVIFLGLAGCVTSASLESGKRDAFLHVNELRCSDSAGFTAVGHTFSLNSLEGAAFHSGDRGLTWHRAQIEGAASGISLGLIALPNASGDKSLFMTGYQAGSSLLSQVGNQYSLQPGAWWFSSDGGTSWQHTEAKLPIPAGRGFGQKPPELFEMRDGSILVALAQTSEGVAVLRSSDGGMSWNKSMLPKLQFLQSVVASKQGDIVVSGSGDLGPFTGQDSFVISSLDGGESWRATSAPSQLSLYLTPGGTAIAFNADQLKAGRTVIHRSLDVGASWSKAAELEGVGRVMSVAADRRDRIIAFTEYGFVLLSDDGGATWRNGGRAIAPDNRISLRRTMFFFDNGIALAVVGRGTILRSVDRGNTWNKVAPIVLDTEGINMLCSNGAGLIVAMGGWTVVRSQDWGATWARGAIEDGTVPSDR